MKATIYIIIAIIAMVVAAKEARRKGRSEFGWGFMSFLFPPIALFAFIATPLNKEPTPIIRIEEQVEDEFDVKKCPYCAEKIKREAIICRFCGKDIK